MGLASRWSQANHQIIIGSRTIEKAQQAVKELEALTKERATATPPRYPIRAADNDTAAKEADIAVLTVPFAHQGDTLRRLKDALQNKILIDVTVPLVPPAVTKVQLPPEGSAALRAQSILGKNVRVVSAFQNVAAIHLQGESEIKCDVLVSSDSEEAAEIVISLVKQAGMCGYYAGPLVNAVVAESLTSVLIQLNKRYRTHSGIRLTGISD